LLRLIILIDADFVESLQTGASIAINGVCLTVVEYSLQGENATITFDVIDETLAVSNLASLTAGEFVNCERSLTMQDELGGHLVSGHVHCQAKLVDIVKTETNCQLTFLVEQQWQKYILPKGYVSINGISLTVGEASSSGFTVHLIPETLQRTNLSRLVVNDHVNIECDQQTITIVTTIERMQQQVK
jgi:riboflavin synthase